MSVSSKPWWMDRVGNGQHKPAPEKWWEKYGKAFGNSRVVEVSPEIAQEWLNRNRHNRRMREALVRKYAEDMTSGRWMFNCETIVFDTNGNLIQGQHRLAAVVMSGVTITFLVAFDAQPESFATMDQGAKRGAADVLGIAGIKNSMIVAAMANVLYRYENGLIHTDSISNVEIVEYVQSITGIEDAVLFAQANRRKGDFGIGRPGVVAAAWLLTHKIDPQLCDSFWEKAALGLGLKKGDPENTLRNRLSSLRSELKGKNFLPWYVELYCMIVAWNARRDGRSFMVLHVPSKFTSDSFPEFR